MKNSQPTKFTFNKYNIPNNWIGIKFYTWLNHLQLKKAKTLARAETRSDRIRRYVVEVFGKYAVIRSTDISKANRSHGKRGKMSVNKLLEESLYIADINNLTTKN